MLQALENKVHQLRATYVGKEAKRKADRRKAKEARDYEIFTEMPYKLSSRKYTLGERHPVSKRRFEAAQEILSNLELGDRKEGVGYAALQQILKSK